MAFQQLAKKAFGSPAVSTRLDEDVDDVAILIDSTPEIMPLSLDGDEDLVQVPGISQATLAALQSTSVFRPELDATKVGWLPYATVMPRWASRSFTSRKLIQNRW